MRVLRPNFPSVGLFAESGVDRPPPFVDAPLILPYHRANQVVHRPALKLRALEPALVIGDQAIGVWPGAAGESQQVGRHSAQQGQLLGSGRRNEQR